jgi:TM2 domain-containing membrane protein YozV
MASAKKTTTTKKTTARQAKNTLASAVNHMSPNGKSMVIYLLLAWFLGAFGAHKFYVGNKKTGTTMLVLGVVGIFLLIPLLITAIWALVDFVVGLCNFNNPDQILSGK